MHNKTGVYLIHFYDFMKMREDSLYIKADTESEALKAFEEIPKYKNNPIEFLGIYDMKS